MRYCWCSPCTDIDDGGAGSKGSVRIKEAAVIQLPGAVRGGLESLFRASQTFNPQNLKRSSLGRFNSLGR